MQLSNLVYISHTTYPMLEDDLLDILHVSQINNEKNGITGMLLYRDNHFIQVLEGCEYNVLETYRQIQAYPRHKNLVIAYQGPILEREFDRWSMGFKHIDYLDFHNLHGFSDFLEYPMSDTFIGNQSRVMNLLRTFRDKI